MICILGSGVVGLCCAYHLRQRGHEVVVVERGGPDRDCCSLGNAGMLVPSHFVPLAAPGAVNTALRMMFRRDSPFYLRPRLSRDLLRWCWLFYRSANHDHVARSAPMLRDLHLASVSLHQELAATMGNPMGLVQNGVVMLCRTEHGLQEESKLAEQAHALGMPAEVLSPEEIGKLIPGVQVEVVGGVLFPRDCYLSPNLLVRSLQLKGAESGVEFRWGEEVTGWRSEAERIVAVRTTQGEVAADEFVLAAGSWSSRLARMLGLDLPLQPGKGYSLTMPDPPRMPDIGAILTEARVAVTPMGTSLRFGGTMEFCGLDLSIDPVRVGGIVKSVPRYFPEFAEGDFRDVKPWCGLRPCSPDGLPYLGRFQRYPNLIAATGHAMKGVSLGPITGKLVAEIIGGEKTSIAIEALRPDRF